jgi:hypothetical protein
MSKADVKNNYNNVPEGIGLRDRISHISKLVNQLDSMLSGLSNVTETSYIWPETEDQYAIKQELEEEIIPEIQKLIEYIPILENRIERINHNLERIQGDTKRLNSQEPIEHYFKAQEAQKKKRDKAVSDKDAISIILAEAQAVLNVSRKKKFPGRKPVRQFPFPGAKPGELLPRGQSRSSQDQSKKQDDNVAGLISLGPIK